MKKKILLLICLILFIVSIAGVSASEDVNQTSDLGTDVLVSGGDTLSVSQSDVEILGSADNGTFTELQTKIDDASEGSTINLENDYKCDPMMDPDRITIGKSLTINGNGYTIDGNYNVGRIFEISGDATNVVLKNINFINTSSYSNGACIYSDSNNLTINDCSFINHKADLSYGGAIYSNGDLTVISSSFADNNAEYGGAISCNGALTVISSSFADNDAYWGGAIYCNGAVTVISSSFADNDAFNDGGAVYSESNENVNIINSTFSNNSPNDFYPEDIHTENITKSSHINLNLNGNIFKISDTIQIDINLDDGATGEVIVYINDIEEKLTLTDSAASLTKSDLSLGTYDVLVKYMGDSEFSSNEKSISFKIVEATFDELQELIDDLSDGDTLDLTKDYVCADSNINIRKNIRINGNGHLLDGNNNQILTIEDSNVVLDNIKFENALRDWSDGSAICSDNSNLTVVNCNFINNRINYAKGAAISFKNGNLNITESNFINNTGGSTIYSYCGILNVADSNFINNSEEDSSIDVVGGKISYDNLTFINNPNITYEKLSIYLYAGTDDYTVFYPNTVMINIYSDKSDKFKVYVNDEFYKTVDVTADEVYQLELSNLAVGNYEVKITFDGDENYNEKETYCSFEIKMPSEIYLEIENDYITVGENQIIKVTLPKNATQSVTLYLNDDWITSSEVQNGQVVFNLTDLTANEYKVSVNYDGDDIYASNSTEGEFKVFDADTIYIYADDVSTLDDLVIDVYVGGNPSGDIVLSIDSKSYTLSLVDGYAQQIVKGLSSGEYEIKAVYSDIEGTSTIIVREATFDDLQNAIDALNEGDTLYLYGDVVYQGDIPYWGTLSGININKSITIDGNGFKINGKDVTRIFNVNSSNVVFKNINFVNGRAYGVYSSSLHGGDGGALCIDGNNTMILNCNFSNNYADHESNDCFGGAIYSNGDIKIINSIFTNNANGMKGGAIFSEGNIICENSIFKDNYISTANYHVSNAGAAIVGNIVNITDSTFENNHFEYSSSGVSGGAIYANTVNVYNSNFTNNTASLYSYTPLGVYGGAIYAENVNVYNSNFNNNGIFLNCMVYGSYGSAEGGAIYSYGTTNIVNSNFADNYLDGSCVIMDGEAIWAYAQYSTIENCTFTNNNYTLAKVYPEMWLDVSSAYNVNDNIKITVLFSNPITGNVTVRINDDERIVNIINDTASLTLSNLDKGTYNVNVTFFENDYVYYESVSSVFKVLDVEFSTFSELQELIDNASDGDVIYLTTYYIYDSAVDGGSVNINKNITLMGNGNTIDGNGIRIFNINDASVVLNNISFINGCDEEYDGSGGAIYSTGDLSIINSSFINNSAYYGGAIYSTGDLSIINSSFINNTATWSDGAIRASEVYIENSEFINNIASYPAAAISADNVVASNTVFINNTLLYDNKPGAISSDKHTFVNCTFENNYPNDYLKEGWISFSYDSSIYHVNDNITITVNTPGSVDKIKLNISGIEKTLDLVLNEYGHGEATLTLNNLNAGTYVVIATCDANDYVESTTKKSSFTVIDDSYGTFTELQEIINNASDGDTIYLSKNYIYNSENDPIVFINRNITIKGNGNIINGNRGSYLVVNSKNAIFDNILFINFESSVFGEYEDDLMVTEYPYMNLTVTNCIFENNYGFFGVIKLYHTNLTLIDSTLINNNGKISIIYGCEVNSINSSFINNTAKGYSASIEAENITVIDSTFSENIINSDSIIHVYDIYCKNTLLVENSIFINNSTDMDDYIYVCTDKKTVINSKFINKYNPDSVNIDISANDINVGDNLTVNVSLSDNATGDVVLSINNNNYTKTLTDSKATFIISNLAYGTYNIIVYYLGDDNYEPAQNNAEVNVAKINVSLTVSASDILIGDVLYINAAFNSSVTGQLNVTLSNAKGIVKNDLININSQNITVPISDLAIGDYTVSLTYNGDNKYLPTSASDSFKVTKREAQIIIDAADINEGEDAVINVNIENATGNIAIDVNGEKRTLKLKNSKASLTLSDLEIGSYNVTVSYGGNDILFAGVNSTIFEVKAHNYTYKDLQSLIDKTASGKTITLQRNYTYDESVDEKVISISKAITINGNGFTINGLDKAGIFTISGNNVVLDNLTLIHANAEKGAAIFISGSNVVIKNSLFEYNTAENGAGIYSEGLKTNVINSSFINNKANTGAGLVIYGADAVIYGSEFISNEAGLGAGAISYGVRTNCSESTFKDNTVTDDYTLSSDNSDLIKISLNEILQAEKTNGIGAGLVLYGDDAVVSNSEFVGNNATTGAGLVVAAKNCIVSTSVFENNTAESGAGVSISGDSATISDSVFTNNTAVTGAGIISNATSTVIDNSKFDSNTAESGAGIVANGENITVLSSTFTNNNAVEGAGIVVNASNATISESEFSKNNATTGAGMIIKALNTTVSNSSFSDNTAEIGTAILVEEEASLIIEDNDLDDDHLTVAYQSSLDIYVDSVYIGENVTINVTVKSASLYPKSGKITIQVNGKEYSLNVVNNSVVQVIPDLPIGEYNVSAKYSGDVNHTASSATGNFTVSKIPILNITPEINGTEFGEIPTITFNLPEDATGKIIATVNGKKYSADLINGSATITLDSLDVGDYPAVVQYSGDDIYASFTYNTNISIVLAIVIDAPDVTKYYKGSERFVVTVKYSSGNPVAGENVTININGVNYTKTTDSSGVASMALGIPAGVYNVTTTYDEFSVISTVTIKSTVSGNDITKIFRNGTQYYAGFVDTKGNALANGTAVTFNINGVFYTRYVNASGVARLNINLNPGVYIITATNPNSTEMYSNTITVLAPIVENNDLIKYYKNDSQYVIKVLDDKGNPVGANVSVTFNINGVFYTRYTNASGYVKMNINLAPGEYIITAEYNGYKTSNTIKVLPTLKASDLSMKYKDGSKFKATVLDGTGAPLANVSVTFNINGVFYNRVSDSNGVASLNINLMAGQYIITSSYNSLNISNKITISS